MGAYHWDPPSSTTAALPSAGRAFRGLIDRFGLIPAEGDQAASGGGGGRVTESRKRKHTGSGAGSVDWNAVRLADVKDVEESIKAGGLQARKAATIKRILDQVWEGGKRRRREKNFEEAVKKTAARRAAAATTGTCDSGSELSELSDDDDGDGGDGGRGELALDHLDELDNTALLERLTSFPGVGYKTASCVMLFCKW